MLEASKDLLQRIVNCTCLELPCIHNPALSEDVRVTVLVEAEQTKKGLIHLYLPKAKYEIVEETETIMKVRVHE